MNFSKTVFPKNWNIKSYLEQIRTRVEGRLADLPLEQGKPTRAREAIRYALDTPGKRFRPMLTIATADIYQKGQDDLVLNAGVALECIHTASLLFDDLPSMDDAALRRGRPTTHKLFGEDQAILAGMCLIAEANLLISQGFEDRKAMVSRKLECIQLLNRSYSIEGLSGGQSDDLLNKAQPGFKDLEYIHAKKTGSLFVACMEIGAVLGGATQNERQWLVDYARNLGLAFQIQDDLLDLDDSSVTGKDQGKDKGKTTFVTIFGGDKCRRLYSDLIDVSLQNLEPFGKAAQHLVALTQIIKARKF